MCWTTTPIPPQIVILLIILILFLLSLSLISRTSTFSRKCPHHPPLWCSLSAFMTMVQDVLRDKQLMTLQGWCHHVTPSSPVTSHSLVNSLSIQQMVCPHPNWIPHCDTHAGMSFAPTFACLPLELAYCNEAMACTSTSTLSKFLWSKDNFAVVVLVHKYKARKKRCYFGNRIMLELDRLLVPLSWLGYVML